MNKHEAGRELDAEIAREVFGRTITEIGLAGTIGLYDITDGHPLRDEPARRAVAVILPIYSTDIGAAWLIVAHFMRSGMGYTFGSGTWPDGKRYHTARFFTAPRFFADDQLKVGMGDGETLPLAICRAALVILGAE